MFLQTSVSNFFLVRTVSSRVLLTCTRNKYAILLVRVSFKIGLKALRTVFLSFASRMLKIPQAALRPFFEESKVGKFSFIVSANNLILSVS